MTRGKMLMRYAKAAVGLLTITLSFYAFQLTASGQQRALETRIVVESEGWKIIGDLLIPKARRPVPAVILLNKANGDRKVYEKLAKDLEDQGIASLRVDLRGHGESTNRGKFVPFQENAAWIMENADKDISAVFQYLKKVKGVDSSRIGFVGASYTGEEMAVSARKSGYGKAYVALSPGSFSEESMDAIDRSNVSWLFIKSTEERAKTLKDFFPVLRQKSRSAQLMEVVGAEHATDILNAHPELAEMLAVWLKHHLR